MRIPKRFKIFGQTITVVQIEEPFIEKDGYEGFASYRQNKIELRPGIEGDKREHIFLHELTHFLIYYSESAYQHNPDSYMYKDEGFTELLAGLLHQALTTMEYEDEIESI